LSPLCVKTKRGRKIAVEIFLLHFFCGQKKEAKKSLEAFKAIVVNEIIVKNEHQPMTTPRMRLLAAIKLGRLKVSWLCGSL